MPALSVIAMPTKRARALELAVEAERRGFPGVYTPSVADAMSLCHALAQETSTLRFGTAIQPIYLRRAAELASAAAAIAELSDGRFVLGLGVSHGPMHQMIGVEPGPPLADTRDYVAALHDAEAAVGPMPPIVLAALRDRMTALAAEVAQGAVWANGARSAMPHSVEVLGAVDEDFFIGDMVPTVIDDDREAAAAVCRRTLRGYVGLPNYRNYWKAAGYVEEMEAVEALLAEGRREEVVTAMSDRWLSDVTLFGSVAEVRDGVEAWFDAGVRTPILVPSSTSGGQFKAIEEVFAAFA